MGKLLCQHGSKTEERRATLSRFSIFKGTDLILGCGGLSFQFVCLHSTLKIAANLGQSFCMIMFEVQYSLSGSFKYFDDLSLHCSLSGTKALQAQKSFCRTVLQYAVCEGDVKRLAVT